MADRDEALQYHSKGRPGKIKVVPTKETVTAHDLSLAYTPGVAEPVREIPSDPTTPTATRPRATSSP